MNQKLKMKYSFKDLACLMDVSYVTFRREIKGNDNLMKRLKDMGWSSYQRFQKKHVLEIFRLMGYPDGFEWYEIESNELEIRNQE